MARTDEYSLIVESLAVPRVLHALRVAAGLVLNYAKTLVVNYGFQSDFVLKRRLLNATGAAQVVARSGGGSQGIPAGPAAADVFWDAAVAEFAHRCALLRFTPASFRQRLLPAGRVCSCVSRPVCRGLRRCDSDGGDHDGIIGIGTDSRLLDSCFGGALARRRSHPSRRRGDSRVRASAWRDRRCTRGRLLLRTWRRSQPERRLGRRTARLPLRFVLAARRCRFRGKRGGRLTCRGAFWRSSARLRPSPR